jgi:hypothetical protein
VRARHAAGSMAIVATLLSGCAQPGHPADGAPGGLKAGRCCATYSGALPMTSANVAARLAVIRSSS